ncbi:MAG: DUF1232 domain-containing protein [Ferruginibacter sp.]|nr:DUF1232 domain-containing protein [Ferruginibacter sp.]
MLMLKKLKAAVKKLKQEIVPIYYALLDKRTSILAKIMAAVTVGYLLSPIDLIPDFIPVLGLLDDLLLVPVLIRLTIKLISKEIIQDIKTKSDSNERLQQKWVYAIPILIIYAYLLFILFRHGQQWFHYSK